MTHEILSFFFHTNLCSHRNHTYTNSVLRESPPKDQGTEALVKISIFDFLCAFERA